MNTTAQLIKMRDFIHGINHTNLSDKKTRPLTIYIMINNEHGLSEAFVPVIWNDEDEFVYAFATNSYDIQTTPAMGLDKVNNACELILLPYSEITQFKTILSEVDFDAVCDKIGTAKISDAQRENIRMRYFRMTDPEYNIKLRQDPNNHY